jgi:hypothetical protein
MEWSQVLCLTEQSKNVIKNVANALSGKPRIVYKPFKSRKYIPSSLLQLRIDANIGRVAGMVGLQIGKKAAVGHFGSWRLPGFLFVDKFQPFASGKGF